MPRAKRRAALCASTTSTIVGKVRTVDLELVSNSIFFAALATGDTWTVPVRSEKKQSGCVRFSYVPPGSLTPRRYRCQPDLEIASASTPRKKPPTDRFRRRKSMRSGPKC